MPAVGREERDEEATPARVLPEGEQRADPVVRRRQRREQLQGRAAALPSRLYRGTVALPDELERIAAAAAALAGPDERVAAVLAAEPATGSRVYVCAYERGEARSWLVLDADAKALTARDSVREAVTIAALCEVAAESAAGGDLDELRAQLVALRLTEAPPGIEEAEEAVAELQRTVGAAPQLATPARLDRIGAAARRLELALDPAAGSPFAAAMRAAQAAVEELAREVESSYRVAFAD